MATNSGENSQTQSTDLEAIKSDEFYQNIDGLEEPMIDEENCGDDDQQIDFTEDLLQPQVALQKEIQFRQNEEKKNQDFHLHELEVKFDNQLSETIRQPSYYEGHSNLASPFQNPQIEMLDDDDFDVDQKFDIEKHNFSRDMKTYLPIPSNCDRNELDQAMQMLANDTFKSSASNNSNPQNLSFFSNKKLDPDSLFNLYLKNLQSPQNWHLMQISHEKHKYLTEDEQHQYEKIGAFKIPGNIDEYDFQCQNKRELVLRAKEISEANGFPIRMGKIDTDKPGKVQFQFVCSYRHKQYTQNMVNKQGCSFFVRYRQNPQSLYFTLADYDEFHNHPVRDIMEYYQQRNQFRPYNYQYTKARKEYTQTYKSKIKTTF
eukprot:403338753